MRNPTESEPIRKRCPMHVRHWLALSISMTAFFFFLGPLFRRGRFACVPDSEPPASFSVDTVADVAVLGGDRSSWKTGTGLGRFRDRPGCASWPKETLCGIFNRDICDASWSISIALSVLLRVSANVGWAVGARVRWRLLVRWSSKEMLPSKGKANGYVRGYLCLSMRCRRRILGDMKSFVHVST